MLQSLVWAPESWRSDLKPMLRFMVTGPDKKSQIKYLTWDQSEGDGLGDRPTGCFFNSEGYNECEPIWLKNGDWNHATICFFGQVSEDGEWEVLPATFQYETIVLPTLSDKAIWAEKPRVEWGGFDFCNTELRET